MTLIYGCCVCDHRGFSLVLVVGGCVCVCVRVDENRRPFHKQLSEFIFQKKSETLASLSVVMVTRSLGVTWSDVPWPFVMSFNRHYWVTT